MGPVPHGRVGHSLRMQESMQLIAEQPCRRLHLGLCGNTLNQKPDESCSWLSAGALPATGGHGAERGAARAHPAGAQPGLLVGL